MVTHSFGKRNFMQPLVRLSMPSRRVQFFLFEGEVGEEPFFFPLVPNVFLSCSHQVPKVLPNSFPKMFPIAPRFAQSSTPMYINQKGQL
jgi:hypothetical protein